MKKIFILFTFLNLFNFSSALTILAPKAPPTLALLKVANENEDIKVQFYTNAATEVIPKIIKDEEFLYILPTNVASKLYNKGKKLKLLGITSFGIVHLLSNDESVESIFDINEKSIYIGAQGSSPDVISRYILDKNNIKPNIKYRTSQEIAKLLITGKIENAILPEPLASLANFKGKDTKRVSDLTQEWIKINSKSRGIPQVALVGNQNFINNNNDIIKRLESQYKKAVDYIKINNNKDLEVAKKGKKDLDLNIPDSVMQNSIKKMNLVYIKGNQSKKEILNYLEELKDMEPNSIGGNLPNEDFFME
ncbi:MAG: DUF3834 domain-containing protein [Fusobacteriota bacterium]